MDIKKQLAEIRQKHSFHEPLPLNCIRVFHVLPTREDGPPEHVVEVSMEVVDLRKDPKYTTLSYTWGHATKLPPGTEMSVIDCERMMPVLCNGKLLLGTRNMLYALQYVRHVMHVMKVHQRPSFKHIEGLPIWADAISINQDDVEERNSQVALMQEIYSLSQLTFAWMGHDDEESTGNAARILQMIHDLPEEFHLSATERNCHGWFDEESQRLCGIENTLTRKDGAYLCRFFSRVWFTRTWVMQEIILSHKALMMFGAHIYDWNFFERSVRFLRETSLYLAYRQEFMKDITAKPELRIYMSNYAVEEMLGIVRMARRVSPRELPFFEAVVLSSMTDCTDPRDKIYGILGIAHELARSQTKIRPDYNKPVADVYVEAFGIALAGEAGLGNLNLFQDPTVKRMPDLPSWCPDLSSGFYGTRAIHEDEVAASISRLLPRLPPSIVPQSYSLSVNGVKITKLEETCLHPDQVGSDPAHYIKILEFIEKLDMLNGPYASLEQSRGEILWRTLLSDRCSGKKPAPVGDLQLMAKTTAFLWMLCNPGADLDLADSDLEAAELACLRLQLADSSAAPFLPPYASLRAVLDNHSKQIKVHDPTPLPDGKTALKVEYTVLKMADRYKIKADHSLYNSVDALLGLEQHAVRNVLGEIRENMERVTRSYTLFRTTEGYLGIGTISAQPGDEVWVLSTGPVPYMLRPLPNGHYQFLGRADIHGFLHKEGPPKDVNLTQVLLE